MTHEPASSSTPTDDNRTLDDLLTALLTADLSEALRSKLRSAVLSTARLLDAHPECLPAKLGVLLARLHQTHPACTGVTRKRLQNLRSDVKRAFKVVGWAEGHNKGRWTPSWVALGALLESKFDRCALTRFFRFCSERGVEPDAIDETVVVAFRHYLETEAFARDPATLLRDLTRVWNRYAETTEGWPPTRLTLPRAARYWSLGWVFFPETLRADTEAWLARQAGDDPLDEFAPPKPLKPATLTARRQQVRMWASALVERGRDPATLATLADLVTVEAFKEALRFLLDPHHNHGKTQPAALAIALLGAARWVRVPPAHLAELNRLVARVRPPRQGLTEKNRAILRQLDNPARRHDLLTFPQTVLAEVRRQPEITYRGAIRIQIALAVELLLMTGIRRANLAGPHLERHLRWTRSPRGNTVHLVFDEHETKNGMPLAFELPRETVSLLEIYLRDYRPALTGPDNPFLFPGRGTGAKAAHRLSEQLCDFVYHVTGLTITTHSFRHISVKLMLEDNPTNYEGPRQFLGHRSVATTVQHYAGEERAAHIRRYDTLVERQRSGAKPLDLRSRPRSTPMARRRSESPA